MSGDNSNLIVVSNIEDRILSLRGQKVMIDTDLAEVYGVPTKALNQAVRRNHARFPGDFIFQLTAEEKNELVTNCDHLGKLKFSKSLPYAFTEHGALMAASVLNTSRAVEVSVYVVRAFIRLRGLLSTHKDLANKLAELERKVGIHDDSIRSLVETLRKFMQPDDAPAKRRIGFRPEKADHGR